MSLEPGLVLGRAALELDWSEKPCLLRALWQFCAIIAQAPLHRPLKERIELPPAGHRRCRNLSGARRSVAETATEAAIEIRYIAEPARHRDIADPHVAVSQ